MPWDKSVPYRRELQARLVPDVGINKLHVDNNFMSMNVRSRAVCYCKLFHRHFVFLIS